jgi:tRNA(Ile2) C34 agmatinyltransferase TiaS
MKHKWIGYSEPGTANSPGEGHITCHDCGTERDDENRDGECPGEPEDDPFACPACGAHMAKIGIDTYRCTRCRGAFTAREA